jgi:hypothetical protein
MVRYSSISKSKHTDEGKGKKEKAKAGRWVHG